MADGALIDQLSAWRLIYATAPAIPPHWGSGVWNSNYYYSRAIPLSGGRICRSGTYWLSSLCKVRKKVGETGDHKLSARDAIGIYNSRFWSWGCRLLCPLTFTATVYKFKTDKSTVGLKQSHSVLVEQSMLLLMSFIWETMCQVVYVKCQTRTSCLHALLIMLSIFILKRNKSCVCAQWGIIP